jgi:glycosyltransferase involved in cell wall biosynthesis
MKIVYLTAGAAGMYCGSCMLDNALAKAMIKQGHDCLLVPLYTPIRTDEENVSIEKVFFGGVNVYLQQRLPLLKWLPRWLDAPLNNPALVKWLTRNTGKVPPKLLGKITVSMLDGFDGYQQKEANRLCGWLQADIQPDCIVYSNLMIGGTIPTIRSRLKSSVWVVLQGDDIFLNSLPEPYKSKSINRMQQIVSHVDGFVFHSEAYAELMSELLSIPSSKRHVVPLGIDTTDFKLPLANQSQLTRAIDHQRRGRRVGYFARISKEKGIHRLVEAFIAIANQAGYEDVHLAIGGYLGPQNQDLWRSLEKQLHDAGLANRYKYHGAVDRVEKVAFLRSIDLLCVPTEHFEPKGLFVLEAVAAEIPYLLPNQGAFPELHARLNRGWIYSSSHSNALTDALKQSLDSISDGKLISANEASQDSLLQEISIETMAKRKLELLVKGRRKN